jgi:hypothetical protein
MYEVLCDSGEYELRVRYWTSGSCGGAGQMLECSSLRQPPFRLKQAGDQHGGTATFVSESASCPANTSAGYTSFTISALQTNRK